MTAREHEGSAAPGPSGPRRYGADDDGALRAAAALLDLGRAQEALRSLGRLVATTPDDPRLWELLAHAHAETDAHERSLQAAERGLAVAPDSFALACWRTEALLALGRSGEALTSARALVAAHPDHWLAHDLRARAAVGGVPTRTEAWEAARWATRLAPDLPTVHATMGDVADACGDKQVAERAYREALRLDPQDARARNNLAVMQLRQGAGQLVDAAQGFVAAGAADPRQQVVHGNVRLVVLRWLQRTHLALFATFFVMRPALRAGPTDAAVGWPTLWGLVCAAGLAWWTWRTVGRLPGRTRVVVWRVLRGSRVTVVWGAACVVAAVALTLVAVAPWRWGVEAVNVAGAALVVGCLTSWVPVVQERRRRR
ncbi:tetratricopeptide repeat protein [Thalassiella azotivora]